jgi:hypothetical protein
MWCAIAMPPYGGFFMAVDPLQKHIFRGALYQTDYLYLERPKGVLSIETPTLASAPPEDDQGPSVGQGDSQ